ncbi:MAG TPA: hypothetical protein VJ890_04905 [Vineibacter sp.]|nr:hypothetical protein [Vineibacter sp.]
MLSRRELIRSRPVTATQVRASLRRTGLSAFGIDQALQGNVVSAAADRAAIARILAAFAALPAQTAFEVFDYPGDYPLKRAGEADVRRGD